MSGLFKRLTSLSLIILGIHATVSPLGSMIFRLVDSFDLALDSLVLSGAERLMHANILTPEGSQRACQTFAAFWGLPEKEMITSGVVLALEIVLILLLIDYGWGAVSRSDPTDRNTTSEASHHGSSRLSLERTAVAWTLSSVALSGLVRAVGTIEYHTLQVLDRSVQSVHHLPTVAAFFAIGITALLATTQMPRTVMGALARVDTLASRAVTKSGRSSERSTSWLSGFWYPVCVTTRGRVLLLGILPLTLVSLAINMVDLLGGLSRRIGTL